MSEHAIDSAFSQETIAKQDRPTGYEEAAIKDLGFEETEDLLKAVLFGDTRNFTAMSQQIPEDTGFDEDPAVVRPHLNFGLWTVMPEKSTRLRRSIALMAHNTVGLGWEIVPAEPISESTTDEEKAAIKKEIDDFTLFFRTANKGLSFDDVMVREKTDEEAIGSGYIEITRNGAGNMDGIFHAVGHTMRVRRVSLGQEDIEAPGYVQKREGMLSGGRAKKRYFKTFGERRAVNAFTGEWATGPIAPELRATEIIQFQIYGPRSSLYGTPRYLSAAASIAGNDLAAKRNVVFFENDAVGRMAILVEGGKLDSRSAQSIESFLSAKGKDTNNAHRLMLLQAEPKRAGMAPNSKTKITLVPLTVGVTDDASFLKYREANDEEIRESYGIAEVYYRDSNANRAGAMTGRQITNEQTFEPERKSKENTINRTIMANLGASHTCFRFKRLQPTDPLQMATIDNIVSRAGGMSMNQLAVRFGMPHMPETLVTKDDVKIGDLPLPIALALIQQETVLTRQETAKSQMKGEGDESDKAAPGREGGQADEKEDAPDEE